VHCRAARLERNLDHTRADICPLVLTTFGIEHALWGLAPLPFHLVNVLKHAACAVLMWRVLRSSRVQGARPHIVHFERQCYWEMNDGFVQLAAPEQDSAKIVLRHPCGALGTSSGGGKIGGVGATRRG